MNRTIFTVAAVFSASSLLLLDSAVKGTVLLALAAVATLILRRDSAATRHLVWLLAIVAMLAVPVLSAMLPQWGVLPAWASHSPKPAVADVSPPTIVRPADVAVELPQVAEPLEVERPSTTGDQAVGAWPDSHPAPVTPTAAPVPPMSNWNWFNALPLVWVIGFSVLILRLTAARWMLWNSERRATVVGVSDVGHVLQRANPDEATVCPLETCSTTRDPIMTALEAVRLQLGIGRPVTLLIHPDKTIPVVWGILRCRLLLPASAREWSDEQLRSVLLHELAHIKRRDVLAQLLTQIACALHWFNPLVWFAAWRLDVERERACDDLVLASGVRPSAYAGHLLEVVTGLSPARWTQTCGLAMARKSSLEGRLAAVLGKDFNRRDVSVALAGLALAIAVGIAVPIAMLRAADEKWNPPHGAHIGTNDFSAYCVHDGKDTSFVIAYHGFTGSSSAHDSNPKTRTWTDSGTLTAKKPGIALSFHRTHTAPDKLSITTAPAEGRDLSNPAPPPREFVQKEYDLAKGRVFLLSDNGAVRQLDIATPVVTDQEPLQQLAALIAAIPPQERQDVALTTNLTGKLAPETVAKLKWGEPVNGLRMALAWPPSFDEELLDPEPCFKLVVQNVSNKEIHFHAGDNAPNPRELTFLANDRAVLVFADEETAKADWHLQAGHCGVLRMFMKEMHGYYGTVSAGIERDLSKIDGNLAVAEMEVAKSPAGAWTGKLVTGQTRGSADVAAAPAPMHKDARTLYEAWQRYARANGDIPGALIGELAAAVKTFIRYNPTWATVPKLNELLPRLDATHDWKPADAIALLDEVAGIQDSPLKPTPWTGTRHTIRQGEALPKKFADAPWGEAQPNGLRAAWVLEPGAVEHRIGAALKARLLVQNTGRVPVVLQVPTFHQGGVKATDGMGAEVQVSGIFWTTLATLAAVRLGPGEHIEINTPGVGLGPRAGMGPWAGPRVGSNVLAKPGDELTLTHSLVRLDGSEVGVSEHDPHVSGPGWWLAHIKARLNRELPLPADAAERTRLLDRAVRELFATAPTAEETEAFIADKTPDAIDSLAKRLAARTDVASFSGKLPTDPAKFRVLEADIDADKQPRVVLGPGEYPLPSTSGRRGNATLKIVGRPVGNRRTNDTQLIFEATEFTGKLPPDPHKLDVPDGWGTWAIVCRPNEGFFYLLNKGTVRKIDYSNPAKVTDTPANDLPAEFRDEVKRILDIHEISAAQQAEIFEKPAAPAATPDSKTGANVPAKDEAQPASEAPKTTEQEAFTAWGKEVGGLQAGLGFKAGEKRAYSQSETVTLVVRIRNVGKETVKFEYVKQFLDENRPTVTDAEGKTVRQPGFVMLGIHGPTEVALEPGKEIVLESSMHAASGLPYKLLPASSEGKAANTWLPLYVGPGKVSLQYERALGNSSSGFIKLDPVLRKLATGKLELEVIEIPDAQQAEIFEKPAPPATTPAQKTGATEEPKGEAPLQPKHESAQKLFRKWQANARTDGKIPGALIGHVAREMDNFLKRYPADEKAPKLAALRPRCDASHDWTQAEVVALLDDITAISTAPVSWADLPMEFGEYNTVKTGQPLPAGLNSAAWGEPAANGLRAAWLLEPAPLLVDTGGEAFPTTENIYQHGSVLKARVLFHNAGKAPVVFRTETWHQVDAHTARDAKGAEIKVTSTYFTGITPMAIYRLLPGEYCEVGGHGIAIGAGKYEEEHSTGSVGAVIEAKVGDEVLLSHTVDAAMSIQITRPDDPKAPAELWKKIVAERVGCEAPVPKEAADRAQLMRRVMLDLLGELPSPEEVEAFTADSAPDPLEKLVERILAKPHVEPWTGKLPTGETKFRVIAADPNAAKAPRTANSPGRYVLGDVAHWNCRAFLLVSQTTTNARRENKATIALLSSDPRPYEIAPPKPYEITLPDGLASYGIVWERGSGVLWLLEQKGLVRKFDFTNPDAVKETRFESGGITNIPEHLREAMNKASGAPVPQAIETEKPKTAATELQPKAQEQEPFTAWGKEVSGLQAGLGFKADEKRAYTHGETVALLLRVRNVDKEAVEFKHIWAYFVENPPAITDADGKPVHLPRLEAQGQHGTVGPKIAPGKAVELYEWKLELRPETPRFGRNVRFSTLYGTGKFSLQCERIVGPTSSNPQDPNPAMSKLATGKLELELKPVAPVQQEAPKPKPGEMLKPATEQKLKWGEAVNGLRMALAWPPTLGEAGMGDAPEFYLVVQNVSDAAVRLTASDAAPNPRRLMMRDKGSPLQGLRDPTPMACDFLLQPREVAFVHMFQQGEKEKAGRITSAAIEGVSRSSPHDSMTAEMSIEKAPAGAWTGKLSTGETRGSMDVIPPKTKDAQTLYQSWATAARADGNIPGALIGRLGESVKTFIKNNPTWETTPQLQKMLPRFDASRDWSGQEAIGLLDELAALQSTPISMALDDENQSLIRTGTPLPEELANAPWGDAVSFDPPAYPHPNGLRVAWLLEPRAAEHRLGTPLKARALIHNSGKIPVVFRTRSWHQLGHKATDAKGAEIKIKSTSLTTRGVLLWYRLAPGEFIELSGPGIGVGPVGNREDWQNTRVGSWLEAKAGDELTVTTAPLPLMDWNDEKQLQLDGEMPFWRDQIVARLSRHLPFPAGKAERELLLYRVAMELFGTPVSEEINAAFVADMAPTALMSLAERLHNRAGLHAWLGTLTSAPTKFRVLPADPDAAKRPRTASNPGEYRLSDNAMLVVTRRPDGERIVNEAHLVFAPPAGTLPERPAEIKLPDGYDTWAAAWVRGTTALWVQQKGLLRKIDFSNYATAEETRYEGDKATAAPIPADIREALRAALTVPDAPKQVQPLLKPAATATDAPKTETPKDGADAGDVKKLPPVDGPPAPVHPRLADDRYAKSGVPLAEQTWPMPPWGAEKEGLSTGLRIIGEARIGGEVKAELWVRNSSEKDVKFSQCLRADVGLNVVAKDKDGKEHSADITSFRGYPVFHHLLLPSGHIVKVKEFNVKFGAEKNDKLEPGWVNLQLTPGDYKLRAVWSDTTSRGAAEGEWTGKLTTEELAVMVVAPDAPAPKPRTERADVDLEKDGTLFLNGKKVTQDELNAQAAKDAKKWFTICADKDVPYAKVVEVVEALKGAGVTEFSFAEARVGDGKYRVANLTANYDFDGKHHFSICRPSERPQWFTVSWPAEGERPACWLRTYPNVSGQTQGKWAVVWEPGTNVLWWVDDSEVGKMTLTDPARVIVDREGRANNFSRDFGLPEEVKTEFRRLGFVIGRDKTPGLETTIGGNTGGQSIVSAEFGMWSVKGTVTDADGKPLANVPVRVSTNQELRTEKTDANGEYRAYFSLPLQLLAHWRGVSVKPVLEGFTERDMAKSGEFNVLLRAGEQPQRVRLADDKDFQPGPIPRFAENDLLPSQPGVSPGKPGRADFVMLKAGVITSEKGPVKIERLTNAASVPAEGAIRGKVLKPDGSPAADVQVRVDDEIERWKFSGEGIPELPKPVMTADDGTFSIEVPKHSVATNYHIFVASDEFAPFDKPVPAGGDVGVMQFAKGSRVTGRVTGLDGAGLAKVGIWCKQLDWTGRGPAPTKLTGTTDEGSFSIPPIATGKYLLQIVTRDLGAKELTVAFANPVIEAKDNAPVAVEIRPLPTVDLTLDARVLRGNVKFPDFELRVSGTLPGHKAGDPGSFWTRQETTKLTEGKHTIAVPAGLQNATVRADRIYMRKDDNPMFIWRREGDEKRTVNNTLELGLIDQPQTIGITVHDAPAAEAPKTEKPASWIPARPLKTTVSAGSARVLDDHSVGLEGDVTWQEATTHFAFNNLTTLDELRLELLPVDSPAGPKFGRGGEELILSEVTARLEKQTGKPTIHEFSSCISLLNPEDDLTIHCIDFLSDTGWIVPALPADAEAHSLVLRFDEPVTLQPDERLVLSVDSGGAQKFAVLNRIRFSFHQAATETGTLVLHAIDADTGEPISDVEFVKEILLGEDWATPVGRSDAGGTVRIETKPMLGYFFSILHVPQGYKVTSLDEVPAHVEVGGRVDYRFHLRKLGTNLEFVKNVPESNAAGNRFAEALKETNQKGFRIVIDDMPGFREEPVTFTFARDTAPLAERIFTNGELVRAAVNDELRYFEKAEGKLAGKISELYDIQVVISSSTLPRAPATSWYLHCRTKDGIELKQDGFRIRFEDLDHWDLEIPAFLHPEF